MCQTAISIKNAISGALSILGYTGSCIVTHKEVTRPDMCLKMSKLPN